MNRSFVLRRLISEMEVIPSDLPEISKFEKCHKRLNLVTFYLNKMINASCLNNYENVENISDEKLKEFFEQLISRCDVSNFSDDLKLKKDGEHHINKNRYDLKHLNEDEQLSKNELKVAKNQVFDLLQKLSLARTEAIKNEKIYKQKIIELEECIKENSYLKEQLSFKILNNENVLERLNKDSVSNFDENINIVEEVEKVNASNLENDIPKCNECEKIHSENKVKY